MSCEGDDCMCCDRASVIADERDAALKKAHDANGTAQRLVGLMESSIRALRDRAEAWRVKNTIDRMETELFVELQRGGMTSWPLQPLLEHAIAVVAELERRGVKAFKMAVDADGNIVGPFDGGKNG